MAKNIGFIRSASVSLPTNSKIVTVTGDVDCSYVVTGTAIYINNILYEGESGSAPDSGGISTITLSEDYTGTAIVGGEMIAFNTIEGLRDAIRKARDMSSDISSFQATFDQLLTSTDPTITVKVNGIDTELTPYGYLANETADIVGSVNGLEDDVNNLQATVDASKADAAASAAAALVSENNSASSLASIGTSVSDAGIHATNASNSANSSANSATSSANSATNSATSANNASTSESAAASSASSAATQENKAQLWADEAVNVEVESGLYSARHWAAQAASSASGGLVYRGQWDASGGAYPSSPSVGDMYVISVTGTMGGVSYNPGDKTSWNGTAWDKDDNTDAITSVAGKTGSVTLVEADIGGLSSSFNLKANLSSPAFSGTVTIGGNTAYHTGNLTLSDLGYTGATNANNYTHPSYSAINSNTSGAEILDTFTTNSSGHVTGFTTRILTLSDLGFTGDVSGYVHPSYSATDINTAGAEVVDVIDTNSTGHVISLSKRTLTLGDLGYTGDTNANNYVHPSYSATDINTSGAQVLDTLNTNSAGHVTGMTTRTMTLANLGFTGDADATNYVHPTYSTTNVNTSGAEVIDTIDTNSTGHVISMTTRSLTASDIGALSTTGKAADSELLDGVNGASFVRIGTTSENKDYLHVERNSTSPTMFVNQRGTGAIARFFSNATAGTTSSAASQVEITNAGGVVADGNLVGYNTSDIRVKSNLKEIKDPLGAVNSFRVREYDKEGVIGKEIGLIAQDIQKKIPTAVKVVSENGYEDLLKIKQGGNELIAYAFGAIQQLSNRLDQLESENERMIYELDEAYERIDSLLRENPYDLTS